MISLSDDELAALKSFSCQVRPMPDLRGDLEWEGGEPPSNCLLRLLGCLLLLRRLYRCRQHPKLPAVSLLDIDSGPSALRVHCLALVVLAGDVEFADYTGRVIIDLECFNDC
jgi:hypothetical protein